MTLSELVRHFDTIAPRELSMSWDNDGVMFASDYSREIKRVLVSLDATDKALSYAIENGFDLLLCHHPLIFKGVKRVDGCDTVSSRLLKAIKNDIDIVSLHTRLDAAVNGVNDALAECIGLKTVGNFGDDECDSLGRICEIEPMDVKDFALIVKSALGCDSVRLTGNGTVSRVALVGGDGKSFVSGAVKCGANVLVTGDAGYNVAEAAAESGLAVIEAGHFHTEFPVCRALAKYVSSLGLYAEVFRDCPYINI